MLEKHMNMCDKRTAIIIRLTENIFNKYNLNIDEYIYEIKEKIETQKENVLFHLNKIFIPEINQIIINFIYM